MSDDEFSEFGDDFDDSALQQLDAIEAAALSQKPTIQTQSNPPLAPIQPPKRPAPLRQDSSFCDISFNVDDSELARLDNFIEDAYQGKAQPVVGPSRASTSHKQQTTLFGDVLPAPPPTASSSKPRSQLERTKSSGPSHGLFGHKAPKTKKWDHTEFAKTGIKGPAKKKGKGKETEEDNHDQDVEFEQFPQPLAAPMLQGMSLQLRILVYYSDEIYSGPPPMKIKPDLLEAKHWIFPINRPKRDYQFNIIRNSLFDNTLVALPTGLGKTFIAGVVMLNYYRWFPEGKVVFVAPTKPLVGQQIDACHNTCGIPARDSVEMTGETAIGIRARHWKEKRVFFMTPQTFVNDCLKETCDIRDIVLLVIDEAHRARGGYAYSAAVRLLMAKNPHHRILALSATPGNKPEIIQELIDALHISRIELRDERSLDLKPYIFEKTLKTHIIKPNAEVERIRTLFVNAMDPLIQQVQRVGLMRPNENALSMHHFRPQALSMELSPHHKYLFTPLSKLTMYARGLMYLLTGSIGVCYTYMKTQIGSNVDDGKKKNKIQNDKDFKNIMNELELQKENGFAAHPKIEKLKNILIQHFGSRMADEGEGGEAGEKDETRVMVFSSYRNVVEELVVELKKEEPLIRPARFIGQGVDTLGNKGLPQKEQLDTIKKFQEGVFNVLVATSIGEEGLDIGEVDLTICYDADKAPTRMVQRFGRTGRKRAGVIHALLAEHKEESNIEKAEAQYREVQKMINKGDNYELYADVERLIPEHIKPQCIEKVVEIEQYDRDEVARRVAGSPKQKGPKRKRNDDVRRNMPEGTAGGFVPVSELLLKGATAKKRKTAAVPVLPVKNFDEAGEDDEMDEDIISGRVLVQPRRTQSMGAGPSTSTAEKPAKKGRLKKAATDVVGGKKRARKAADSDEEEREKAVKPKKRKTKVVEPSLSQFSRQGEDDSDDMDIANGAVLTGSLLSKARSRSPTSPVAKGKGKAAAKRKKKVVESSPDSPPRELTPLSLHSTPAPESPSFDVDRYSPVIFTSPTKPPSPIPRRSLSPEFAAPRIPSPLPPSSPPRPASASPDRRPSPFVPTSPIRQDNPPDVDNDDLDDMDEVPDSEPSRTPQIPLLAADLDSSPLRGSAPLRFTQTTNPQPLEDMSWLVDNDEDDNLAFEIVASSPPKPPAKPKSNHKPVSQPLQRMTIGDESIEVSMPVPSVGAGNPKPKKRLMKRAVTPEVVDDSVVEILDHVVLQGKGKQKAVAIETPESSPKFMSSSPPAVRRPLSPLKSPVRSCSPPPLSQIKKTVPEPESGSSPVLASPKVEPHVESDSDEWFGDNMSSPSESQPIQPVRAAKRRKIFDPNLLESPVESMEMPPPSQRRLHRMESTPLKKATSSKSKEAKPKVKKPKRAKPTLLGKDAFALFDGEAGHSGDEISEGSSGSEDEEDEEDRRFIKDSPLTQASTSYDQSGIYRRSLQTQVPWGENLRGDDDDGPIFEDGPVRARPFGHINGLRWNQRRHTPSSSPPPPDDDLDRYDESFVVDDDAELLYDTQQNDGLF
ncbi:hypothetical protein CVT24_011313 [Panaeolus cyanescens]|uniref:ATP-dependent DNA helicase n=1 Tax=Panaeolus cyanescens TaxID=181874 RepID=A0A409VL77_9AGAR|nr:hypothetical protein CVT24_011313 [Panaeolus cyanescens]